MFNFNNIIEKFSWNDIKNIFNANNQVNIINTGNEKEDFINNSYNKFNELYTKNNETLKNICSLITKEKLIPEYRLFIWQIFLDILPYNEPDKWKNIIDEYRSDYSILKEKYLNEDIKNFIKNPLIKGSKEYEKYKSIIDKKTFETITLIKLDVERTFKELDLFKKKKININLINVLYIYSNEFPVPGYMQGMNEICGVLIYVLYRKFKLDSGFLENDKVKFCYFNLYKDNFFIEDDLYVLFKSLMNKDIREFYRYNLPMYKNSSFSKLSLKEKIMLTKDDIDKSDESEIKKRFYLLFYKYLIQYNLDYGTLLVNLIEPDIFLLRWYLCLFSREFNIDNLLKIWDIILCYEWIENTKNKKKLDKHLNYIEFICISMLKEVKNKIKENENDSNAALITIMHYPEEININNIILNSIKICKKITNENIFEY
jgi:TBC1 domain family protein 5